MEVQARKPTIWLSKPNRTWLERAVDEQGTLDVLSIAAYASVQPETLQIGEYQAFTGITINDIRGIDGKAGSSKELAVPIDGIPLPTAQSASHSYFPEKFDREEFVRIIKQMGKFLTEKERKASQKSFRISEVDFIVWEDIKYSEGINVVLWRGQLEATVERFVPLPSFRWDDRVERAQADRYIPHLNQLQFSKKWMVIDAANRYPDLLDCKMKTAYFRGTTDAAIPHFELKKTRGSGIDSKAPYQAMISLVLANMKSNLVRPVAMLTDLDETWILFWIDGFTVFSYEFETRAAAVAHLEYVLRDEDEMDSTDPSPNVPASGPSGEGSSGEMRRSFSKRRKFSLPEMERLDEFVGLIPDEELEQDREDIALKHLLRNPVFSSMWSDAEVSSPQLPDGMYT